MKTSNVRVDEDGRCVVCGRLRMPEPGEQAEACDFHLHELASQLSRVREIVAKWGNDNAESWMSGREAATLILAEIDRAAGE